MRARLLRNWRGAGGGDGCARLGSLSAQRNGGGSTKYVAARVMAKRLIPAAAGNHCQRSHITSTKTTISQRAESVRAHTA